MNTTVSVASLASGVAIAAPSIAAAAPLDDRAARRAPAQVLARAEAMIDALRNPHIGFQLDEADAARALKWFQEYGAGLRDSTDDSDEFMFVVDFIVAHGQSFDWIFSGDIESMVRLGAWKSERAAEASDVVLRRLWDEYRANLQAHDAARALHEPRRAALDRDLAEFYKLDGNAEDRYSRWGGWQGWHDAMEAAHKKSWRKHKVGGAWRQVCKFDRQCRKTIKAIRAIEARTPFGVGVKLAALPPDRELRDNLDYVEAMQASLPDLDKLCGGTFAAMSEA